MRDWKDDFYEQDFPKACRRLGYISSQSRMLLLGRHALRCIGLLARDFRPSSPEHNLELLPILRTLLESQLFIRGQKVSSSAPYFPTGRPHTFSLARKRGASFVELSALSGFSHLVFPHQRGHHTDLSSKKDRLLFDADLEFVLEIREATRSTNLSTKRVVDERCRNLTSAPLWVNRYHDGAKLSKAGENLFNLAVATSPTNWSFWQQWYQGILKGDALEWELQHQVAQISDEVWGAGSEAVAAEIERIKAKMLSESLPMAETIELNPETGQFRAVPIPVENASYMSALLSQIGDALEDSLGGHNGLSERSGDAKKLNRVLTKYKDDPQNAELTLTRVAGSLRAQLHDSRELPDNGDNLALLSAVEEGVRGIRANHPEVAANREQLAHQAFKALAPEDKQVLEEALPVLTAISEAELAEDFAQDIPELINDALMPLPDGAPPLPGPDAATRVFSRVSRMAPLAEKAKDYTKHATKAFESDLSKTIRLAGLAISVTGGVGGVLYAVVQIGLRVLGVL